MPTTADQTPFATMLPPSGWQMIPDLFARETERNTGWSPSMAWPGFATTLTDTLPAVGVVGDLTYVLTGSTVTTHGTGTLATTDAWPHGLIARYVLRLNGQATPWNVRGQDIDVLRAARTKSIAQGGETSVFTTAGATTALQVQWNIPLALDPALSPSVGGLFAQSVNSTIVSEITTAAVADVVTITGNDTYAMTGASFTRYATWYAIPTGKLSDGSVGMVLPDLTVLHGLLSQEQPIVAVGDQLVYLNRVAGTIARMWQRMKNGNVSSLQPFGATPDLTQLVFTYANNQRPRTFQPASLRLDNERRYRGVLPYSAFCIDNVAYNLQRDAVDVEALSNPQLTPTIANGSTVNAGARLATVYELLTPLA